MKKIFIPASCVLCLLLSCSPQRRIARIAEKYNLTAAETLTVTDTVVAPGDTLFFRIPADRDTVIITEQGRIETVVEERTVHVKVTTPPDTIVKTVKVPVERIVVQKPRRKSLRLWMAIAAAAVLFSLYAQRGRGE